MGIHKKIFPVAKMPWHDDDHKFGQSVEGAGVQDTDVIHVFQPPRIDSAIETFWRGIGTVCLVDSGRCYYCGFRAIYAFQSRLYCATCWIGMDENG